jgi:homogentisate 1,2-dioxygenase
MRYEVRGRVPAKRHTAFRLDDGTLLTEEVMGFEGFSGNESILYHLQTPCRVTEIGSFEPIEQRRVGSRRPRHHRFETAGVTRGGDAVRGRQLLMFNDDVEIAVCRRARSRSYFFRNGEGDEVIFVHEGGGSWRRRSARSRIKRAATTS